MKLLENSKLEEMSAVMCHDTGDCSLVGRLVEVTHTRHYTHTHTHTHKHMHTHTCTHTHTNIHMHTHTHTHTHTHMHTCTHTHTNIHMHTHKHTHVRACVHACLVRMHPLSSNYMQTQQITCVICDVCVCASTNECSIQVPSFSMMQTCTYVYQKPQLLIAVCNPHPPWR